MSVKINMDTLVDGSIRIKVGRRVTILKTDAEADAFMCGARITREAMKRELLAALLVDGLPQ